MKKKKTLIYLLALGLLVVICVIGIIIVNNSKKENKESTNQTIENNSTIALNSITDFTYSLINDNKINKDMSNDSKMVLTLKELEEIYGLKLEAKCNENETKVEINYNDQGNATNVIVNTMCD